MTAAWYEKQGRAREVLVAGEMADPRPGPGEVRIRIAASSINPRDVKKRQDSFGVGMPYPRVIPHSDTLVGRGGRGQIVALRDYGFSPVTPSLRPYRALANRGIAGGEFAHADQIPLSGFAPLATIPAHPRTRRVCCRSWPWVAVTVHPARPARTEGPETANAAQAWGGRAVPSRRRVGETSRNAASDHSPSGRTIRPERPELHCVTG
jgi:hypothetical protein